MQAWTLCYWLCEGFLVVFSGVSFVDRRYIRGQSSRIDASSRNVLTERTVVCFQGDGLEFKRLFLRIKQRLGDVVSTQKILLPVT